MVMIVKPVVTMLKSKQAAIKRMVLVTMMMWLPLPTLNTQECKEGCFRAATLSDVAPPPVLQVIRNRPNDKSEDGNQFFSSRGDGDSRSD
ncbi:uncharacterized protein CLUP02_10534 [Colletotrichum lupini]|uniref:Uncharacterized protein n=1 Tax=Colletotrichum lupini TaxID=145971 RepID=A0A9Q8SXI3_9PEZI|nr:uncharacterized protein CLUP02_10534 [Colletotrichum lupini]UQC85038.1 hypothetical protein CLUP02_10534 [Colletotrichum lupini]